VERTRDETGRFQRLDPLDDDYLLALLLKHQSGLSVRALANELGRSKSVVASDLAEARRRQRAQLDAERDAEALDPEPRRSASVLVLDADGLKRADGSMLASARSLVLPPRRHREGFAGLLEEHERDRLIVQAWIANGLNAQGLASFELATGTRGSYDPHSAEDVERARRLIRDELGDAAASTWQPHPGLR
jgi:hypothetical protein